MTKTSRFLGALVGLVLVSGLSAWTDDAHAAPRIDLATSDVGAEGMFQGRTLRVDIHGGGFGATPGLVEIYDGASGAFLGSLDGSFDGMWWSDSQITLTIDDRFTQNYEARVHAYDFLVVHATGARSRRAKAPPFKVWSVPRQGDWTFYGPSTTNLRPAPGKWDARLNGMISPSTAVKLNGTTYLYYIGASGDRTDGGPAYRTLGVATSTDGIHFQKRGKVQGIRWPTRPEEGVFSAAAAVHDGRIVMYYSSCREVAAGDVACEGYRATSTNGLSFQGERKVLSGADPYIDAGSGNELFPVGVVHDRDVAYDRDLWVVAYVWKDTAGNWYESTAWSEDGLTNWRSGRYLDPDKLGGIGAANSSMVELPGQHALMFPVRAPRSWPDYRRAPVVEVHGATHWNDGGKLDFEYSFPNTMQAATFFDASTRTWYLYGLEFAKSESCGSPVVTCHRAAGISVRKYTAH